MDRSGLTIAHRGSPAGSDAAGSDNGGNESASRMAIPLGSTPDKTPDKRQPVAAPDLFDRLDTRDDEPAPIATLEPARALALADFAPPAVGAGERLLRMAYRFGIGPRTLNPFAKRVPPRLTATVANPLPGDAATGTALRAGHFLIHGLKAPIADTEFSGPRLPPPLERCVHGFTWLTDLETCAARPQCTPVAERIFARWLDANPRPDATPAWDIGNVAHRLLGWLIHAPLILSSQDRKDRSRALHALDTTANWLDRHVGRAEDKLAEVAGWTAITAAGLLMADGRARRLFGEAGLIRALGDLVGDDGGVLSRSPLCQIEAIELLVRLKACYAAVRAEPPAQIDPILALLVPPLLALLHGDGALASFQGAHAVPAARIEAIIAASCVRTRPLRDVRHWGYQRVAAQKGVLLFDAAPPPVARHARDGCASTLAMEFSHGAHRLIVNCGGGAAAGGLIPLRLAQGLRATAAHSTLTIDDFNSTAVLINGKLGSGVAEVDVDRRTLSPEAGSRVGGTRLEASHNGYVARYGLTHRRILILRDDGTELRGEDCLVPTGRKGKRGTIGVALRFHLGPHIELAQGRDGLGVTLALPDGSLWQFRSGRDAVVIEDSLWADGQGRPVATRQLVIAAKVPRSGETFSWLLKKMR